MYIKRDVIKNFINEINISEESIEICFDSRDISNNSLFVALNGANFKAARFVSNALKNGARYAIVNETDKNLIEETSRDKCYFVNDTTSFIKELATESLKEWKKSLGLNKTVIGITGSNGKTSTKELLLYLLEKILPKKAQGTKGNLNNHFGVPITVFSLQENSEVVVFEIGTNNFGEIKYLSEIIKPDVSIITSIGQSHLEAFVTEDAVFTEKIALFDETIKNSKIKQCCFFSCEDKYLKRYHTKDRCFVVGGNESALHLIKLSQDRVLFTYQGVNYNFGFDHLIGTHHYLNFLNCFSVLCEVFEIEPIRIIKEAKSFKLGLNRGEWKKTGNLNAFLDCYNSNPSSLRASLESFVFDNANILDKTLFVIGDMYELGENSGKYHREAGSYIKSLGIKNLLYIGHESKEFFRGFGKEGIFFKNVDDADLSSLNLTNISTLYLKGSRGVGLEKLLEKFKK